MTYIANEYLVNYGRTAFLGRFVNGAGLPFDRNDRVVVQSGRGIEAGVVLSEAAPRFAHLVGVPSGDILRRLGEDDAKRDLTNNQKAIELQREAQDAADSLGLPLTILDAEILLDADRAIVHLLPFAECDPTPLRELLSRRHGYSVSFLDPRTMPEPDTGGCGKPGCGSSKGSCTDCGTGGGCSTGSCSSGKVKDAKEMTDYFVQLRQKVEREFGRVPLHG
jgi:hypothetical protein